MPSEPEQVHWKGPGQWRSYAEEAQAGQSTVDEHLRHMPGMHDQKDHASKKQVLRRKNPAKGIQGKRVNDLPDPFLTPEEEEAVRQYTITEVAADINWHLRNNKTLPEHHAKTVKHLTTAMDKNRLDEHIEVTRYTTHHAFDGDPAKAAGAVVRDKAILSTTIDENADLSAVPNAGQVKLTIVVPKGSPGIYVDRVSTYPGQKEFIQPPGTRLATTGMEGGPPWQIRQEVVR